MNPHPRPDFRYEDLEKYVPEEERWHETHICRNCGAEITLPYAKPDTLLEGYWERAYWRLVPKLAALLVEGRPSRFRRLLRWLGMS